MKLYTRYFQILISLLFLSSILLPEPALGRLLTQAGMTGRVSVASDGTQGNGDSVGVISADGRSAVFFSDASNLVSGDTNGSSDVFVRDLLSGQTTRVSVSSDGTQGNFGSWGSSISADGRFVVFQSDADNLVMGDVNHYMDVFVHDRQSAETTLVSIASDGTQGDRMALLADISDDGRYVAFESPATNLVTGDTNNASDIFVHDRVTGETDRVSVSSSAAQGDDDSTSPAISADGRFVAFESSAGTLVDADTDAERDVFVHDRVTGETNMVSVDSAGMQVYSTSFGASISADGRYVAFASAGDLVPEDTNWQTDVFVHDRLTGEITRVSVSSDGTEGNNFSSEAFITPDGRYVAFSSSATNLDGDHPLWDHHSFVHDRVTGKTTRVSLSSEGTQGYGMSGYPTVSADGRFVTFSSTAENLVDDDTNGFSDVFLREWQVETGYALSLPLVVK